jgi:hypothetical protein
METCCQVMDGFSASAVGAHRRGARLDGTSPGSYDEIVVTKDRLRKAFMAKTVVIDKTRPSEAIVASGPGPACTPGGVRSQVRSLFAAAGEEVFHDGMESRFSRGVLSVVRDHGHGAIEAIREVIEEPGHSHEAASEALRWLGEIQDPKTSNARLQLLEGGLRHPSARVRDAAGIGLSALGDPHGIPFLESAVERETVRELRADLQQILDELRESAPCRS